MPIFKTINSKFFKTWSPEMAYVLGYFAADGCMSENKRGGHFMEFSSTDRELIECVQWQLGSNHKIKVRNRLKDTWKVAYRLQIGSKEIYNDLLSLGLTPAKSLLLRFPEVPNDMLSHFVRGYFDGDGHVVSGIYPRKNRSSLLKMLLTGFTCGSQMFLIHLRKALQDHADMGKGSLHSANGCYKLTYSINDSFKLYQFMYNNAEIYLRRKKLVFEKFFSA